MTSGSAVLIAPRENLAARVCGSEDGLSIDELLAKSMCIVEQKTVQWRHGALQEVSRLRWLVSRVERDPRALHSTMHMLFSAVRDMEDQASILELDGVREAAVRLSAYLARADVEGGAFGAPQHHMASIATLLNRLEAEIEHRLNDAVAGF